MAEEGLRVGVVVLEPFTANGLPDPAAGSDEYETAWPVYVGETPIGRTTSGTGANEICLLRKGLSKRHAVLDVEMDPPDDPDDPDAPPLVAAWIMDLGSTNGTRLQLGPRDPENAKPVKLKHHRMYQLLHNSIIQMGTTRLRFLLDDAEDPSEAPLPVTIPPSPAPTGHHHHNHNLFASPAMLRRQGMMARGGPGLGLDQLPATVAPGGAEDEEEQPGDAGDDFECTPTMAPEEIDPRLSGAGLGGGAGGGGELAATLMAGDAGGEDFLDDENVEDPQVPDTLRRPQQQQQQSHQQQQQQQRGVLPRHISFSMVGTEATLMPAEAMDKFEDDEGDTGVGAAAAVTEQDLDETVVSPANSAATAAAVRNLLMETQDPEESAAGSLGSPANGVTSSTEQPQGQQGQPQQQRSMSAAIGFDAMETVPAGDFYAGDEDQEEEEEQEGGHGKSEAAGATASQGSLRGSPSIPSLDPRSLDRASQVGFNHTGRQSRAGLGTMMKDSDSADDDLAGMADGSRSDNNNDDDDGDESPVLLDPEDEEEVQADASGVGEQLQSHAGPKTPPAQLQRQDAMIDDDDEIVAEAEAKAEGAQEQEQELDLTQDLPAPMPETPKLAGASASETNGMEVVAGTEEVDTGDHIMEDDDDIDAAGGDGEDINARNDDTEELAALGGGLEPPQVQLAKQHQHAQSRFATVTTSPPPPLDQPLLLQQPYPADQPPADVGPEHEQETADESFQRHGSSSSRSSQPVRVKEEPMVVAGVVEPQAPVASSSSSSNSVEHVSAPSAAVSSSSSEHATASSSSSSSSSSSHTAAWSSGPETPFSSPSSLSSPSPAAAKGLASSAPEEGETTEDDPVPVLAPAAAHSGQQSPPPQASPLASVPEASETAETTETAEASETSQGRRTSGRPRRSSKTPSSSSGEAASSPASSSSTPETAPSQAKTQPRSQSRSQASRSQPRSASQASVASSSVSTDPAPATRASRRTRRGSTASTQDEAEDAGAMQDGDVANQDSDQDVAQKKVKQEPQDEQVEQEEAEPEKEKEASPLTRKASTRLTGRKRGQPEPESSSPPSSAVSPSTPASTSSSTAASSSTTSRRRQKPTAAGSSSAAAVVAEEIVAGSSSADASGAGKTSRSSRGSARSKSGSSVASTPVAAAASSSNGERSNRKRRATTAVSSAAMDTADADDGGDAQEQAEDDVAQGETGGDDDHEEEENKEAQEEQADAAEEQDSSKPPARKRQRRSSNASASGSQPQSVVLMVTGIQPNAQTIKKAKVLGATFTEDPFLCTHVVTDKFKRTAKMMCAFALARPLVNQDWLEHSLSKGAWQDDSEYRLPNLAETQTKYNFAIGQSYARVREQGPLLTGWTVYSTKNVKPAREELEQIVRSCGGKYSSTMPRAHAAQRLIISCEADRALWPKLVKLGYRIHAWEALASGVLQQELDLDRNRLDVDDAEDEENGKEAVDGPKPKSKTGGRSRR